jgi:hypothetical protein
LAGADIAATGAGGLAADATLADIGAGSLATDFGGVGSDALSAAATGSGGAGTDFFTSPGIGGGSADLFSGGSTAGGDIGGGSLTGDGSYGSLMAQDANYSNMSDAANGGGGSSDLWKTAGKVALKYGPLGMNVLSMLKNSNAYSAAAKQLAAQGGPQRQVGNSIVQGYQSGTLNPAESATIDKWVQDQTNAMKQFYASSGQADSTQAQQAIAAIAQKGVEMKNQAIQNLLTTGLSTLNSVDANTRAAISTNLQGDVAMMNAEAGFMQQFAKLIGSGG